MASGTATNLFPLRFATHSRLVQQITTKQGWLPAARYTNMRDVREFASVGFVDIDWKNYDFNKHLQVVKQTRPHITIARDIEDANDLDRILDQAHALNEYSDLVALVPKDERLGESMEDSIPKHFLLGYSTPSKYGGTTIPPEFFKRKVHLLGGTPKRQLHAATVMDVYSFDCNRFTLDAKFGDYFDGERFRPHPVGGYSRCIEDSVLAINAAWAATATQKSE